MLLIKSDRLLEAFQDKAKSNGYESADWEALFRCAIREDWAGLRQPATARRNNTPSPTPLAQQLSKAGEQQRRNLEVWLQQDAAEVVAHELH